MKAFFSFFISIWQIIRPSCKDCVRISWAFPGQDYTSSQTLRITRCKYNSLLKTPWSVVSLRSDLKKALSDGRPMPPYIEACIARVQKGQIVETKTLIRTHVQVAQAQTRKTTTKKGSK